MTNTFSLADLSNESLDAIISLDRVQKANYIAEMVRTYYPKISEGSDEYINLIEEYISSFYVEKLYRSNRFFNEKFTPVYTKTGLIRNIILDSYYTDDDLIVH